ncbi:helix-turn-helix domain-containing protein [Pampinifervens florentissimum]|uniref:helix-turn-helix domain-containing protein n=1 Tax=Pampinifervens florentissimum TaxID=1632019 RepID=UPI0013B48287|nr:helix-turn-helix domain-containing protein [Hydrogenobacter sp. T-8]QID33117.1 helix-turn-helix domain-containing protein [Hydrogenobacter sp. T-8]
MNYAGLRGNLVEKDPKTLPVAREDFYIRKALDLRHVEKLKQAILEGEELPPVIMVYVKELEDWRIVNGNHTAKAHELLQRPVKVFEVEGEFSYEDAIRLQLELNPIENLPVSKEDLKVMAIRAYKTMRQVGAKRERAEIIQRLALIFKKSERQIYRWLDEVIEEEDRELKEKAVKLWREGKTQEEIAKELGVPRQTISDWLKANNYQVKTYHILPIFDTCQKSANTDTQSHITITKDFSDLMERYYEEREEGQKLEEWAKSKGIELDPEELQKLKSFLSDLTGRTAIEMLKDTQEAYEKLLRERLKAIGFGTKAVKALVESFSKHKALIRKTCEELIKKIESLAENLDLSEEEILHKAFHHEALLTKYRELFMSVCKDEIKKALSKYPVLSTEEISLEAFYELAEEELEQELKAQYPDYRIPRDLIEWLKLEVRKKRLEEERRRLEEERARQEEERKKREEHEKAQLSEIISSLRTSLPDSLESFLMSLSDEDRAVALKYMAELKRVFDSLPKAPKELIEELAKAMLKGLTEEEAKEELRAKGYVPDTRPVLKAKEELLRKKEEELRKKEEALKPLLPSSTSFSSPEGAVPPQSFNGEVVEGQVLEEEELDDELFELLGLEEEELEKERGITLRGVKKKLEKILKLLGELKSEMLSAKGRKTLEKALKECEETLEKIEVVFRRKERYTQEDKAIAKVVLMRFSELWQEEKGTGLAVQDKSALVKRVLEIAGKNPDKELIKEKFLKAVEGFFEYVRENEKREGRYKAQVSLRDFIADPFKFELMRKPSKDEVLMHNLKVLEKVLREEGQQWIR